MAAKIHPKSTFLSIPSSLSSSSSSKREVFTVWMKSLIMNSNGCTVFDSDGRLAYRVDNYDCKFSSEVHLMDARGKLLITILKKKFRLFETWEGYRSTAESSCFVVDEGRRSLPPLFRVRRKWRNPNYYQTASAQYRTSSYQVGTWNDDDEESRAKSYCMESEGTSSNAKSAATCKIMTGHHHGGHQGCLVAEVKQKQSWSSGVSLGDDVLTFAVEPGFDHSFAVGLLIVHQLFNHKL